FPAGPVTVATSADVSNDPNLWVQHRRLYGLDAHDDRRRRLLAVGWLRLIGSNASPVGPFLKEPSCEPTLSGWRSALDTKVLVVDDERALREAVCEVLADAAYLVASAANGKEALAWLEANPPPQLILLDLMMPVMDGYAFREVQRADPRFAGIPVIAFSAGTITDRTRALGVPILRKPMDIRGLL